MTTISQWFENKTEEMKIIIKEANRVPEEAMPGTIDEEFVAEFKRLLEESTEALRVELSTKGDSRVKKGNEKN